MNCFGQTDTLEYSISGKCKYEFDHNTEIISLVKLKEYKDFKFKLKKDELLYLDLVDGIKPDTLYLMYRNVTIYYRDGEVEKLYCRTVDNTLHINGSYVKKIIVHKPELK